MIVLFLSAKVCEDMDASDHHPGDAPFQFMMDDSIYGLFGDEDDALLEFLSSSNSGVADSGCPRTIQQGCGSAAVDCAGVASARPTFATPEHAASSQDGQPSPSTAASRRDNPRQWAQRKAEQNRRDFSRDQDAPPESSFQCKCPLRCLMTAACAAQDDG